MVSSSSSTPLTDFFNSFWAAVDGRALSSLERSTTAAAFLSSLLECLVFFVKRIWNDTVDHTALFLGIQMQGVAQVDKERELRVLVGEQFRRIWEGLTSKRLRADHSAAGTLVAQNLVSLRHIDGGRHFFNVPGAGPLTM